MYQHKRAHFLGRWWKTERMEHRGLQNAIRRWAEKLPPPYCWICLPVRRRHVSIFTLCKQTEADLLQTLNSNLAFREASKTKKESDNCRLTQITCQDRVVYNISWRVHFCCMSFRKVKQWKIFIYELFHIGFAIRLHHIEGRWATALLRLEGQNW